MDKASLDLTYSILVKDRKRGREIASWEEYYPSDKSSFKRWRLNLSNQFKEWSALALREPFKYRQISVNISELEYTPSLRFEIERRKRFKERSYRTDLPEDEVNRLQMIFQNDMDMLIFKMRWL